VAVRLFISFLLQKHAREKSCADMVLDRRTSGSQTFHFFFFPQAREEGVNVSRERFEYEVVILKSLALMYLTKWNGYLADL